MLKTLPKIHALRLNDFNYLENPLEGYNFGISKNKVYFPGSFNYYEIKLMVQDLGIPYFLPTSLEMKIAQEAGKVEFDRTGQITESILAHPSPNNVFTKRVRNPVLERGGKTMLLERTKIVENDGTYFIDGGKRTELEDFINPEGKVRKDVREMGLKGGNTFWLKNDCSSEEGLRTVARFDKGALALFSPWYNFYDSFYICVKGNEKRT